LDKKLSKLVKNVPHYLPVSLAVCEAEVTRLINLPWAWTSVNAHYGKRYVASDQ